MCQTQKRLESHVDVVMKRQIELSNQVITAAGTSNNRQWLQRVQSSGGQTTTKIGDSTTLLIAGDWPTNQLHLARGRGLVILSEDQAEALLEHGVIELLIETPPASSSLDELIGPMRAIFDQPPGSSTWNSIIDFVERCTPEQLPMVASYIDGNIRHWDGDTSNRWEPSHQNILPKWEEHIPTGDVRVMPCQWITKLLQDEAWAALTLPRVLHLDGFKLGMKKLLQILSNTHLTNLEALYLGLNNRYAPSLWKTLLNLEALEKLHTLGITSFHPKDAEALSSTPSALRLRTVELHIEPGKFDHDALRTLFASPSVSSITTLRLKGYQHDLLPFLRHREEMSHQGLTLLPSLDTLHLVERGRADMLFDTLTQPWLAFPERVVLEAQWPPFDRDTLKRVLKRSTSPIKLLDISRIQNLDDMPAEAFLSPMVRTFWEWLHVDLPASPFMRRINAIKLGHWSTPRLIQDLEDNGTKVIT